MYETLPSLKNFDIISTLFSDNCTWYMKNSLYRTWYKVVDIKIDYYIFTFAFRIKIGTYKKGPK